jgi:hypothetical protein
METLADISLPLNRRDLIKFPLEIDGRWKSDLSPVVNKKLNLNPFCFGESLTNGQNILRRYCLVIVGLMLKKQMDAQNLEFADNTFDTVVASVVFAPFPIRFAASGKWSGC